MNNKCKNNATNEANQASLEILKERMKELNIPQRHAADFLGVHKCTLQKWLNGKTVACSNKLYPRLTAFLKDAANMDIAHAAAHGAATKYMPSTQIKKRTPIRHLLEKFARSYEVCNINNCGEEYLLNINDTSEHLVNTLLQSPRN